MPVFPRLGSRSLTFGAKFPEFFLADSKASSRILSSRSRTLHWLLAAWVSSSSRSFSVGTLDQGGVMGPGQFCPRGRNWKNLIIRIRFVPSHARDRSATSIGELAWRARSGSVFQKMEHKSRFAGFAPLPECQNSKKSSLLFLFRAGNLFVLVRGVA